MLTISAPIEIKAKSTYLRDPEAFYHRITGNYSLMETRIDAEDLLHVTATPPEIYVQEAEGMTSILSRSERNETNLNKVDILNNVMNRIVVSADASLTYQDRVFITDALYKMGIRDDRRFMESFYQMAQETKNTNTLINLYLERGERLREIIETVESNQKELIESRTEVASNRSENFLYNSVLERLKTGAIYQIVSNFNRTVENNEIDQNEYSMSNQTYTAQHILLSVLRERAGVAGESFTFLNSNTYEEDLLNENTQVTNVRNEMTSAVMMDLLKNIYHTAYDRFYNQQETYYRFEDTFYGASDQTFVRLVNNLQTDYAENRNLEQYITNAIQTGAANIIFPETEGEEELTEEEIKRISDIISVSDITDREQLREVVTQLRQEVQERNLLSETSRFSDTEIELLRKVEEGTATEEEIKRISEFTSISDITDREQLREAVTQILQENRVRNLYNETRRFSSTEMELLRKVEEGTATEEEIKRISEISSISDITDRQQLRETVTQVMNETRARNLYNETRRFSGTEMELLRKVEEGTATEEEIKRISDIINVTDVTDREKLREDVTRLRKETQVRNLFNETNRFSGTEMELLRKVEEGTATEEEFKRVREIVSYSAIRNEDRIRDILNVTDSVTNTGNIYNENNRLTSTEIELLEKGQEETMTEEEIRRITETVNQMNIQNERRRQRYVSEIQKIREAEATPQKVSSGIERTRRDAALALTNPAGLMEELERRSEVRAKRQNNIINELQSIFPDQSMEIYQILNRLREGDTSIIQNNIARPADLGELIYNINTVNEPTEEERKARVKAEREQEEIQKAIDNVRDQERTVSRRIDRPRTPVETVHRSSETLTTEELNEQLNMMQNNIQRQMNKTVQTDVVTENRVVRETQVVTNETKQNELRRRDIEQLIENGVKSQMSSLSNQVINKIERTMKNEKMRRGY